MKLIASIPRETDDVTSDFDNIIANAKDSRILFILLLNDDDDDDDDDDVDVVDDDDAHDDDDDKQSSFGNIQMK